MGGAHMCVCARACVRGVLAEELVSLAGTPKLPTVVAYVFLHLTY